MSCRCEIYRPDVCRRTFRVGAEQHLLVLLLLMVGSTVRQWNRGGFFFRLLGWALVCSGLMIKLGVTFRIATGLALASQCTVKLTDQEGLPDSPVREFMWRAVCAEASGFASVLHGSVARLLLSLELGCKGQFVGDP